jgi:predicted DNA-binding protein
MKPATKMGRKPSPDAKRDNLTIRVGPKLDKALRAAAGATGEPRTVYARRVLEQHLLTESGGA